MNKLDNRLTHQLQAYLATDPADRDVRVGADLLLRLNRNRALHQNILRRPEKMASKLDYELKKHLRIRLDGLTLAQVVGMEKELLPQVAAVLEDDRTAVHAGRRADHDSLPAEIRAIYDQGGELYAKMRQIFETLKQMESQAPCDRYELLCILSELDSKYRQGWATYDGFTAVEEAPAAAPADTAAAPTAGEEAPAAALAATAAAPTAKEVNAARKYLSRSKKRIATLKGEAAADLLQKMQQRIDLITASGGTFDAAQADALRSLGLNL